MRLYLVQHGAALTEAEDPQRPLSEEGRRQTEKMARFLKMERITVDCIWHSKKMRSIQTAQIISHYIRTEAVVERNDLSPLDPVEGLAREIQGLSKDLMIVGHLPFLSKLAAKLLVGSEHNDVLGFKYSGGACLEYQDTWKIIWMITPDLV